MYEPQDPGLLLAAALVAIRKPHPTDVAFEKRTAKRRSANKRARAVRKKQRKKK